MNKPQNLQLGDKIAIVSLSNGILGESFAKHELELALRRLEELGLEPVIMPNALKGMTYLKEHPEARAADLKNAFMDNSIKAIITAIGGNDTYKLIPYLMEDEEFKEAVRNNPKIFTGFSDTTINHLMLNRLGLSTFYGPCLIIDIAEFDNEMLPYTKEYFDLFFNSPESYEIRSSDTWYLDRTDFSVSALGTPRIAKKEEHGYEVLNGNGIVTGQLFGGCIESLYDAMTGNEFSEEKEIIEKYNILPTAAEWKDKILFLETSELMITPETLKEMLLEFKNRNIFNQISGLIIGKPIDEKCYEEYKEVYREIFKDSNLPIMYNINFGHAVPRCVLPYNAEVTIDYDNKKITVHNPFKQKNKSL